MKADNVTLSTADRDRLKDATFQIFIESGHEEFATSMLASADPHMIAEGSQSVPVSYGKNGVETLQWKENGSIKTPWFGEDFKKEFFLTDKFHHRVLDFPGDLKDQVGNGSLVIELEIDTRRLEDGFDEWVGYKEGSKYKSHKEKKTQYEAASQCQAEGGHLASILSEWENSQVAGLTGFTWDDEPWIGGVMEDVGEWRWSDGSSLDFSRINPREDNKAKKCVHLNKVKMWRQWTCDSLNTFVCQESITPVRGKRRLRLEYTRDQLTFPYFQVWYSYKVTANKTLYEMSKEKTMTGFKLSWRIERSASEGMNPNIHNKTLDSRTQVGDELPRYKDDYFSKLVQLAKQMRLKNMTRQQMLKETIEKKVLNTTFLDGRWCPDIFDTKQILIEKNMLKILNYDEGETPAIPGTGGPPPPPPPPPPSRRKRSLTHPAVQIGEAASQSSVTVEDIENGILINAAIGFCSKTSRDLFKLFGSLVRNSSPKELIQTLMNTVLQSKIWERSSKRELHAFYLDLDNFFDLQHGKVLLAISGADDVKSLIDLENLPFFENHKEVVEACLGGENCQELESILKSLGNRTFTKSMLQTFWTKLLSD